MTREHATSEAIRQATKYGRTFYVIWSPEDHDEPREHYHATDDETLLTFYSGVGDPMSVHEPPAGKATL